MRGVYILLAAALVLSGCVLDVGGPSETVVITSEPATASFRTSIGHLCPKSPCMIEVRRRSDFTAYASLDGYKPGSIYVALKVSKSGAPEVAGNNPLFTATGVSYDHFPNPAHIKLKPVGSEEASTNITVPTSLTKAGTPVT